jgi:hypothetical protein
MRSATSAAKKGRQEIEVPDRQPLDGMTTVAVPTGR